MTGKSAIGGPLTVRLEPCGAATGRLVDAHGQPLAGHPKTPMLPQSPMGLIRMIVTPGAEWLRGDPAGATRLFMAMANLSTIDPINYPEEPISDAQGRIVFPVLIPGATYRVSDFSMIRSEKPAIHLRREFTVKPGETVDLGDILIEKPDVALKRQEIDCWRSLASSSTCCRHTPCAVARHRESAVSGVQGVRARTAHGVCLLQQSAEPRFSAQSGIRWSTADQYFG